MKKMLFLAAVSAIALTSCVNEENFEGPKPQAQVMRFDAPVMKQTRANVVGEIQGHLYDKKEDFKIFCKIYKGTFTGWETNTTDYFSSEGDLAKNEGGESSYWSTVTEYYWPEKDYNLAFAAYSPAVLTTAPTSIEHTANGLQIKGFQTEANANLQYDLMYSDRVIDRNRENNGSVAVPLVFRHALSSIVFSSEKEDDKADYTIKTATLAGSFVQKADFNQNIAAASDLKGAAKWEEPADAASATYAPNFDPFNVTTTPTKFTEKASALLLIPQAVPADAAVTITYTKTVKKSDGTTNSTDNTATIKLSDFRQAGGEEITVWEMGKRYIYRIAFGQNRKIYFEPKTEDWVEVPTLIYEIQ